MKKIKFNNVEKLVSDDINDLQSVIYQSLYEKMLRSFFRNEEGFLGDSFKPTWVNANTLTIATGRAFKYSSSETGFESKYKSIQSDSEVTLTYDSVDWLEPSLGMKRIDVISVTSIDSVISTDSRKFKNVNTGVITDQTVDKVTEQTFEILITQGVEHATSPVAPSVPTGYIEICTVLGTNGSGIALSTDLYDKRNVLLPSRKIDLVYAAIVGSTNDCTHSSLELALADPAIVSGDKILVVESATLNTPVTISKSNIAIEFGSGVTYTNGTATTCFIVSASGTRISKARFSGFTTAITISSSYQNNFVTECRFASCTNEVTEDDSAPNNVIAMNLTE